MLEFYSPCFQDFFFRSFSTLIIFNIALRAVDCGKIHFANSKEIGSQASNRHLCDICEGLADGTAKGKTTHLFVQSCHIRVLNEGSRLLLQATDPIKFAYDDLQKQRLIFSFLEEKYTTQAIQACHTTVTQKSNVCQETLPQDYFFSVIPLWVLKKLPKSFFQIYFCTSKEISSASLLEAFISCDSPHYDEQMEMVKPAYLNCSYSKWAAIWITSTEEYIFFKSTITFNVNRIP